MKKTLLCIATIVLIVGLASCTIDLGNSIKNGKTVFKSLKINTSDTTTISSDSSKPTVVKNNSWTELGLADPVVTYLKEDQSTETTVYAEATFVKMTAGEKTVVIKLDK